LNNFADQFAEAVARHAGRPAISVRGAHGVERFTYSQLDAMASSAAAALSGRGIAAGDRCAILAENSARWCAAYLGILKLGAVAVPFDTTYQPDQVTALLRDSGARCIVHSPKFLATAIGAAPEGCTPLGLEAVTAPAPSDPTPSHGRASAPCPATLSDAAVILYTSGTTADPKGVVLTHGNLLAEKNSAFQVVHVDEHDVVLGVLPLFHALAQMANLLLPFSLGAHVVFLETLNTKELLTALQEERVSVFCCVPQFFYLIHQRVTGEVAKAGAVRRVLFAGLMRANAGLRRVGLNAGRLVFGRVHQALGPAMRFLITGGSKFDPAVGHDLHAMGFTILQAYGLTETSGAATLTRPGEPIATVGRPLPGTDIRIAPPAAGYADGEVLIRGPLVMAGYWNRPDATAAVMQDGWFHSGDLGQVDAYGRLTITGRSKEIIVLQSGKNIYPEEIETHYRQSPFIKELCVMGVTDPNTPSAERLHAIVVPDADVLREKRIVNVGELIRFEIEGLSVAFPGHKRVLGFDVSMEPLPRTTTGKLKRHEIARASAARTGSGAGREPEGPRASGGDEAPHVIAMVEAVTSLMARPVTVRADSNFELDLGLDSMERVELLAGLEQRFGVRVAEEAVQQAFTVRQLADAFQGAQTDGVADLQVRHDAWPTLLQSTTLTATQQEFLRRDRRVTAAVLFVTVRALSALLFRPRVRGLENLPASGPFILSPNHQSYLDPFALVSVLPFRIFRQLFFVGAAEYFETPLSAWLARQTNVIPVDADAKLLPAMQAGAFGLRTGKVLVLFPEGERSIDGTVKKFKKGAGLLSEHLDVPIVPVAIDGMFDIWPRHRAPSWSRLLPWSGHRVDIAIGAPLPPAQRERLRDAVDELWRGLAARSPGQRG
jgi:long-chain acyl-CoA synthetase